MSLYRVHRKVSEGVEITGEFDDLDEAKSFLNEDLEDTGGSASGGSSSSSSGSKGRGRPKGSTSKKKPAAKKAAAKQSEEISDEELRLELNKIVEHENGGGPMAKSFLGKHKKVSDVPQGERQEIVDAVAAKLAELDGEGDESGEDSDDFLE